MIAANQSRISIVDIKRLAEDIEGRLSILSSTSDTHNPDGSNDIDVCTLDTIDDTLTHSLSQVRTLRNEKAPINTLPPEILVIILEILAGPRSLSSTSPLSPPGSINPLEWMAVTHVCRYWRRTALGYPFLWSPIVFSPPDIENTASLPYEWLRRSSGAPLDVQISCGGTTSTRVWTKLAERSQRLRKLHISDLTDTEILLQFNGEAPLLESLCLRVSDRITDIPRSDEDDGGALLSDELPLLFAGSTSSLRYLTITFFTRFGGNQFANLTYLHVADQIYDTPSDLSRLLVLLETSPGLEEFIVERCTLRSPNDDHIATNSAEPFISMPSLRRLAFDGCHATLISIILFRLELSSHGVSITCRDWQPSERHIATIFPAKMRSRIYPLHDVTKLELAYDTAEIRAVSPTSATHILFENDLDVVDNIAPGLRLVLSFHALQELWLSGIELHSWQFWQDAFGAMPVLAKLVLWLTPTNPKKWIRALTQEALSGRPYPAPALNALWVFPPFPDAAESLLAMLEGRASDGHRVHQLRVMCRSDIRSEEIRRQFEAWKGERVMFERTVDEVAFEIVPEYPRIDVPEACRTFMA